MVQVYAADSDVAQALGAKNAMPPISTSLRILGFEAFDAGSHRAVRQSITTRSRHQWTWLTRPGRSWKWRIRLAAPELVRQAARQGVFDREYDGLFATSLMSVSDLRAMLPTGMRDLPIVLYMHENQAAYPVSDHAVENVDRDVQYALTNLTSVLAADRVAWNSQWNLDSFIAGMKSILAHHRDSALGDWREVVQSKSVVSWPPVEPPPSSEDIAAMIESKWQTEPRRSSEPINVLWPHRWEHDKGPDELLDLASQYTEPLNLRWTILGERFDTVPAALSEFCQRFGDHINHIGFVDDRQMFWRLLAEAHWVLSTAQHEFFGIAVVEALMAGCLPWLPNRLSYPELLPEAARKLSPANLPDDPAQLVKSIGEHLETARAPTAVARLDDLLEEEVCE